MPPRETFGDRVFSARNHLEAKRRQRVTLAEFGALVGKAAKRDAISASSVQRWEQGSVPEIGVISAIARACGVDPGWLAFGAECAAPMLPAGPVEAVAPPEMFKTGEQVDAERAAEAARKRGKRA